MKISPLPADTARALAFAPAALLLASLATLTPSLAAAQTTLVEREFPTPFPLGADAAPIEDLDGDNIADILVWSRGTQPFVSTPSPPFVRTVSGLTLETLQSFPVPASWTNPMGATPIADRDGDGLQDIAVHSGSLASGSGEVRFYSTGTGVSLGVLSSGATNGSFGADVLLLGDVNGDGVGDLAVSEPARAGSFRSGAVYVLSGSSFLNLYTVLPPQISQWDFGRFVLPLGDLDGDGVQDFSASFGTTQGGAPPSGFYAVSGASGDFLWSALGGQSVGTSIALLDDMDGDGTPDVATARDGICPTVAGSARISIRSGATGTLISSLIDPAGSLGCDDLSVAPTSDLDGDGLADLGVGIRHVLPLAGVTSRVAFISSVTGAVLGSIDGDVNSGYGLSVAMTADLNEDGVSELIVGGSVSLTPSATYPGYVSIVSPVDSIPLDLFGGAIQMDNSTGTHTTMGAFGSTVVADNDVTLFARNMRPGSFGFFLNSLNTGVVPGMGVGLLFLGAEIGRFVGPGQIQQADATGRFSLAVDLTQWPTPLGTTSVTAGQTWHFQAWNRDVVQGAPTSRFSDRLTINFE